MNETMENTPAAVQEPAVLPEKKYEAPAGEGAAPETPRPEPENRETVPGPAGRNFEAEWKELAEAHPEVVGSTLPEDIFQACVTSGKPPLQVYESMMLRHLRDEIDQLKQENDRLRQNADNAQRAPVTGTASGGSSCMEKEDPFVAAFRRTR